PPLVVRHDGGALVVAVVMAMAFVESSVKRTLKSLCANRVNLCAGTPFEFPAAAAAAATTTKTGPTGSTPMMTGGSGGHRKGTCSVATQTEGWMMPPLTQGPSREDLTASDTPYIFGSI
ncbi:hypothetical protein VaNZ11_012015, partial [Volvox africanus]